MKELSSCALDDNSMQKDEIYWARHSSGNFSVTTAYDSITNLNIKKGDIEWNLIWKLKVPNRICNFLWLLKNGKVMCNVERKKRNFTDDTSCDICMDLEEDLNHIFRFCSRAKPIWSAFIPEFQRRYMDTLTFIEWFSQNLRGKDIAVREGC